MAQTEKPLVIPVFIPHSGCPHQCAFCNQSIITGQKSRLPDKTDIHNIVSQYLKYRGKREWVELAFFGGNFLGLPHDMIIQLLDMVQPYIKGKKIAYFFSHDGGGSKVVGNIKGTIEMKNELIATKDFLKPLKFSKGCLKEAEAWAEEITKLV